MASATVLLGTLRDNIAEYKKRTAKTLIRLRLKFSLDEALLSRAAIIKGLRFYLGRGILKWLSQNQSLLPQSDQVVGNSSAVLLNNSEWAA